MLYIISTPIGNLEDITSRALKTLAAADFILAEDTRRTGLLFKKHNLPKKFFLSFHEHNENKRIEQIVKLLKQGKKGALVSNAGTPSVSDPGYKLVKRCYEEKIKLSAIPGPCAVINALVLSGLPTDNFLFLGFLPRKRGLRIKKLKSAQSLKTTLIIFESPFRLEKLLSEIEETLGNPDCAVTREMTKVYEEVRSGRVDELIKYYKGKKLKGEITLVVNTRD